MRLSGQAFLLTLFGIVGSLTNLLSSMVLARIFSVTEYGQYKQVWLIYNTATPFIIMGILTSVPYYLSKWGKEGEKTVLFFSFCYTALTSLVFAIICYFLSGFVSESFNSPEIKSLLKIFAFYPLFYSTLSYKHIYFVTKQKPILAGLSTVLSTLLLTLTVIATTYFTRDIEFVFKCILSYAALEFTIYLSLFLYKYHRDTIKIKTDLILDFLKSTSTIGVSFIILSISLSLDKYFISTYYDSATLAVFTNGSFQIPFIGIITGSIMSVVFPRLVELMEAGKSPQFIGLWHECLRKSSLVIFPICALCFIKAENIMLILFGNKYLDSAGIFQVYLLLFSLRIANYTSILVIFKDFSFYLFISIIDLMMNFMLNYYLIEKFGVMGPAYGTVLAAMITIFIICLRTSSLLKTNIFKFLPIIHLAKNMVAAIASASIVLYISKSFPANNFVDLGLSALCFALIYILISICIKSLSKDDLQLFKSITTGNKS